MLTIQELDTAGVKTVAYDGPIVQIPWKRLLLAALVLVGGVAATLTAERARGQQDSAWWIAPLALLAIGCVYGFASLQQLRRLRQMCRDGEPVIGWSFGGFRSIPSLCGRSWRGVFAMVGSPVVGVFMRSGSMVVLVDQVDVGYVQEGEPLRLAVGHRGDARWLLVSEGTSTLALRLWSI